MVYNGAEESLFVVHFCGGDKVTATLSWASINRFESTAGWADQWMVVKPYFAKLKFGPPTTVPAAES